MKYRKSAAAGSKVSAKTAARSTKRGEAMSDQSVRIENWEVVTIPWQSKQYLHGEVYGHPQFPDGHTVTTSRVIDLSDEMAVTKSGTVYRLGRRKKPALKSAVPCLSV
jgi:hypothetical protein